MRSAPNGAGNRQSSNQASAERDGRIEDLSGVFWAELLVVMRLCRSLAVARKVLRREHRKGRIRRLDPQRREGETDAQYATRRRLGFEIIPSQRGIQVFTNSEFDIPANQIETHEIPLSRMLAKFYPLVDEIRGPYWVSKTLADREMFCRGQRWRWEFFNGKQDLNQLLRRSKKYKEDGSDDPILCVCRKEKYFEKLKEAFATVREFTYYATYEEVMSRGPLDAYWRDPDGDRVPITLPGADGVPDPVGRPPGETL